jgi:hypothetical protein
MSQRAAAAPHSVPLVPTPEYDLRRIEMLGYIEVTNRLGRWLTRYLP